MIIQAEKQKLATAIASLVLATQASHVAAQVSDEDPTAEERTQVREEVIITGSRIKRTDYQGGAQVVEIDRVQIEALGSQMVADVLRSSPLNTFGSFSERSGSSAQSNAFINLRGLGEDRTLVMINGRRIAGSPNYGASAANINMIPMAAVERIDILADGGSAVYGSDAVAGVVNMQFYDDFEGLQFNLRYGDRAEDDGNQVSASILAGMSGERGNVTIALETNSRDAIRDLDREYTAPWARDIDGDGVIDATLNTDGYSLYGASIGIYDPDTGYDRVQAATNCSAGNGFLGVVDADIDWGYPSDLDENTYCMYGYADVSTNKANLDRTNAYVSVTYDVTDDIEFFTTGILSRVESFGRFAPAAAPWPNMPADYAAVPFDIPALQAEGLIGENYSLTGYYRWTNIGNRDDYVTDNQYDFAAGFRGDITSDVSFETYVQSSEYYSRSLGYYYLSYTGLDNVIAQGIDPLGEEAAGPLSAVPTQDNFTKMIKAYGHVQFGLGDWFESGDVLALVGAEYFEIDYQNLYDRASEEGLIGGSAGNSSDGSRDVEAAFAEIILPVMEGLEVNTALRYDSYSDFGSKFSPTVSATYAVNPDLTLRGRWGQGFRAPSLSELYGPETFSAESASDQLTCAANNIPPQDCSNSQFDTWFSTNPDLDAEESETFSLGFNWRAMQNLTLDLGYWDIEIDNIITQPSTQDIFYAEAAGVQFAPSSGTYVDRSGGRAVVRSTYVNQGIYHATGLDLRAIAVTETGFGSFVNDLLVVHNLKYKAPAYYSGPSQDTAGFNLQPEFKAQWIATWSLADHTVDVVLEYVGKSSQQDFIDFDAGGTAFLATSDEELGSWTTINAAYTFSTERWGYLKLGATNLFNREPILDRIGKYDVTHYDLYDNTGRVVYLEYGVTLGE